MNGRSSLVKLSTFSQKLGSLDPPTRAYKVQVSFDSFGMRHEFAENLRERFKCIVQPLFSII